jgi:signal transduction histidine kinase
VQEALTNARKHAPGAEVLVHLAGSPGNGLTVEVRNQPVPGPAAGARVTANSWPAPGAPATPEPADDPGAGQGLAGLAERVALASGRLEHGPADGGGWRHG